MNSTVRPPVFRLALFLLGILIPLTIVAATMQWMAVDAATTIHYVTTTGSCTGKSPCYSSIQAAVDAAADGDEIRVAAGLYAGAETKVAASTGYTYTQVVLVDGKSLSLRGGYTTSSWNNADPVANPTILNATGFGRGITIVGTYVEKVIFAGFQIVDGDYTGLGNSPTSVNQACPGGANSDCAGGLFAHRVQLHLSNALLRNNTASRTRLYANGGGALLWELNAGSQISNTRFFNNSNVLEGYGGGMAIQSGGAITISNSYFEENHSEFSGGGLYVFQVDGPVLIENSRFVRNTALGRRDSVGGAIYASVVVPGLGLQIKDVEMVGNETGGPGAALAANQAGSEHVHIELANVLATQNRTAAADESGSVFDFQGGTGNRLDANLLQTTIAANRAPTALRAQSWWDEGKPVQIILTNTLISSATHAYVGLVRGGAITITHSNSLLHDVTNQHTPAEGTPVFDSRNQISGDPKLDSQYRLLSGSAAIDQGIDSAVAQDLDGDPRPTDAGYDVGADEFVATQPGTFRFSQATYGTGESSGHITIVVERIGGNNGPVSVDYATGGGSATAGSDYKAINGTLAFAAGETSRTFAVQILGDSKSEEIETVHMTLMKPGGGALLGSPAGALLTIVDDDVSPAGQFKFSQSRYTTGEGGGKATITVLRTNGASGPAGVGYLAVDANASAGSDYTLSPGTLDFADGETSRSFTITILEDRLDEADETFNLALRKPTGGAVLGTPSKASLEIEDNDNEWLYLPTVEK